MAAPQLPEPHTLRARIAELGAVEKKLLGGMILLMIKNHTRVRDREWLAEIFARLSVSALDLEPDGVVDQDLDRVSAFVNESMASVLDVALPLFARVAADMADGSEAEGFGYDDACEQAMSYFATDPRAGSGDPVTDPC